MLSKTRIAVTGGSGFIGTNLVQFYARQRPCAVLNLDLVEPPCPGQAACWKKVDITDGPLLREALLPFAPDYLVHLAARTDLKGQTAADYRANTAGTATVLAACGELPSLRRVLFASTKLVCKNGYRPRHDFDFCPDTAYGQSKAAAEALVRGSDRLRCPWTIVRPTSIWGPWFGAPYRNFFRTVQKRLYLHPRGARPLKTYGYVGNTVYQIDRLLQAPLPAVSGRVFYLGDYLPLELYHWAVLISRACGAGPPPEVPPPLLKTLARGGDLLLWAGLKRVPYSTFRFANILAEAVYDLGALEELCGVLPYTLEEGVRETTAWMKGRSSSGSRILP